MHHSERTTTKRGRPATADRAQPTLELKRLPAFDSPTNDAVTYGVIVRNTGAEGIPVLVRLQHDLPAGTRFIAAEPPAQAEGGKLSWDLGWIAPGGECPVSIVLHRTDGRKRFDAGQASYRATFKRPAPASLDVVVRPHAPIRLNDTAELAIEVRNTGGRPANQVRIAAALPAGLHRQSGQEFVFLRPVILPLNKVRVVVRVRGVEAGDHPVRILVTSDDGVEGRADSTLRVTQPRLALRFEGPAKCELGRQVTFRAEVVNEGTELATGVRIACAWPEEFQFVAATEGAPVAAGEEQLGWTVGDLTVGETKAISLSLAPRLPGDIVCHATAEADNAPAAEAVAPSSIGFTVEEFPESAGGGTLGDLLLHLDQAATRDSTATEQPALPTGRRGRGEGQEHVVFTLDGTDYAVPISNVLEIGRPLPITPVPNVPDWVLGVSNVRGDIVSMIDLRQFLGLARLDQGAMTRLIVVRGTVEEVVVGLRVDQVKGICGLNPEAVVAPTSVAEGGATPYLRGVTERDNRLLAVFDLDRLLASQEGRSFDGN